MSQLTIATVIYCEENGILVKHIDEDKQLLLTTIIEAADKSPCIKTHFTGSFSVRKLIDIIKGASDE